MAHEPNPFGTGQRRPSRAERRERERRARAAAERDAAYQARYGTGAGPATTPSPSKPQSSGTGPGNAGDDAAWLTGAASASPTLRPPATGPQQPARPWPWPWPVLAVPTLAAGAAFVAAAGAGGPAVTGTWQWPWLAGSLTGAAAAIAGLWWVGRRVDNRLARRVAAVVVALFAVFAAWGSTATVVIDGTAYPVWSTEAQIDRTSRELYADLTRIAAVDDLLAQDAVTAKVRFDEYGPARGDMLTIADKWTERLDGGLPTTQLAPIVDATRAAAFWAANGLEAKEQWVVTSDAKLAAQVTADRQTVATQVLTAGGALRELTALYGIVLVDGPADDGVVE